MVGPSASPPLDTISLGLAEAVFQLLYLDSFFARYQYRAGGIKVAFGPFCHTSYCLLKCASDLRWWLKLYHRRLYYSCQCADVSCEVLFLLWVAVLVRVRRAAAFEWRRRSFFGICSRERVNKYQFFEFNLFRSTNRSLRTRLRTDGGLGVFSGWRPSDPRKCPRRSKLLPDLYQVPLDPLDPLRNRRNLFLGGHRLSIERVSRKPSLRAGRQSVRVK